MTDNHRTLFRANSWPTSSDDDPIEGWVYEDYNKHFLAAREDTYGAGFSLVRDLLSCFCRRVAHGGISFELHCVDAAHIGARMGDRKYDRIEVRTFHSPNPLTDKLTSPDLQHLRQRLHEISTLPVHLCTPPQIQGRQPPRNAAVLLHEFRP